MKKALWITLIIIAVIIVIVLAIRLFSGEDNWICQNGVWVKHGHPTSEIPVETCR